MRGRVAGLSLLAALGACGGTPDATPPTPRPSVAEPSPSVVEPVETTPSTPPAPGTVPPAWLGTRELPPGPGGFGAVLPTPPELVTRRFTLPDRLPPLPGSGFESRVVAPPPAEVLARSTWQPGCPVGAADLAWVQVVFLGFDGARHTGELLVDASVAQDVVKVFGRLWEARFPMEELRITRLDELDAPPTGDGNNTSAFVCRVKTGGGAYSEHAYGLAVDLNPFQNPYSKGEVLLPELASAYLDRSRDAPGMITPEGPVVAAFREIGWQWGGTWRTAQDRHHFSRSGR